MPRYRDKTSPCPTCNATYGEVIPDRPDRCGVCVTGLSLDGRPIYPVRGDDGVLRCPLCIGIGANCELEPSEDWPDTWQHVIRIGSEA